jgi:archaeal flagellar protein FlaI
MDKVVEEYIVTADMVPAQVKIIRSDNEDVPIYDVGLPEMGEGTEALLTNLREELAEYVPLEVESITDPEKLVVLKKAFYEEVKKVLTKHLAKDKNIDLLSGVLVHRMYGLGFIDIILADDLLEEIAINGAKQNLVVYHRKHGWCKTTVKLESEEQIYNLSSQIGRKVGREINSLHPIMDAHLLTGDRVASTLFPITTAGNTLTIRRFSRTPLTVIHMISPEYKTLSLEIAALMWLALQYELNVLVAGGTASGKTSMLSALAAFLPPSQRILTIEDTREIFLPETLHWNWVPMTTRNANPEGKGEVTMLDLMISSLRMRPDRILVGEVRRKEQAETMFEAMHTGHSVYTTIHADTVEQVKRRLLEPPIEIPKVQAESLHIILIQFRDRRKGIRRVLEVAEVLTGGDEELDTNFLYRWRPRDDVFEKANASIRLYEELNIHTGMTHQEIDNDLKEKESILKWMLENDHKTIDQVGEVLRQYYKDKEGLMKRIRGEGS